MRKRNIIVKIAALLILQCFLLGQIGWAVPISQLRAVYTGERGDAALGELGTIFGKHEEANKGVKELILKNRKWFLLKNAQWRPYIDEAEFDELEQLLKGEKQDDERFLELVRKLGHDYSHFDSFLAPLWNGYITSVIGRKWGDKYCNWQRIIYVPETKIWESEDGKVFTGHFGIRTGCHWIAGAGDRSPMGIILAVVHELIENEIIFSEFREQRQLSRYMSREELAELIVDYRKLDTSESREFFARCHKKAWQVAAERFDTLRKNSRDEQFIGKAELMRRACVKRADEAPSPSLAKQIAVGSDLALYADTAGQAGETESTGEMVDALDMNGRKTGEQVSKRQAHTDGTPHPNFAVFIFSPDGSQMLVQVRSRFRDFFPGMRDVIVAGHGRAGESPVQIRDREANEEFTQLTGIKLDPEQFVQVGDDYEFFGLYQKYTIEGQDYYIFLSNDERGVEYPVLCCNPTKEPGRQLEALRKELDAYKGDGRQKIEAFMATHGEALVEYNREFKSAWVCVLTPEQYNQLDVGKLSAELTERVKQAERGELSEDEEVEQEGFEWVDFNPWIQRQGHRNPMFYNDGWEPYFSTPAIRARIQQAVQAKTKDVSRSADAGGQAGETEFYRELKGLLEGEIQAAMGIGVFTKEGFLQGDEPIQREEVRKAMDLVLNAEVRIRAVYLPRAIGRVFVGESPNALNLDDSIQIIRDGKKLKIFVSGEVETAAVQVEGVFTSVFVRDLKSLTAHIVNVAQDSGDSVLSHTFIPTVVWSEGQRTVEVDEDQFERIIEDCINRAFGAETRVCDREELGVFARDFVLALRQKMIAEARPAARAEQVAEAEPTGRLTPEQVEFHKFHKKRAAGEIVADHSRRLESLRILADDHQVVALEYALDKTLLAATDPLLGRVTTEEGRTELSISRIASLLYNLELLWSATTSADKATEALQIAEIKTETWMVYDNEEIERSIKYFRRAKEQIYAGAEGREITEDEERALQSIRTCTLNVANAQAKKAVEGLGLPESKIKEGTGLTYLIEGICDAEAFIPIAVARGHRQEVVTKKPGETFSEAVKRTLEDAVNKGRIPKESFVIFLHTSDASTISFGDISTELNIYFHDWHRITDQTFQDTEILATNFIAPLLAAPIRPDGEVKRAAVLSVQAALVGV